MGSFTSFSVLYWASIVTHMTAFIFQLSRTEDNTLSISESPVNATPIDPVLELSVYDVSDSMVEIEWHSKGVRHSTFSDCELVYGPFEDDQQVEVLSNFVPDGHTFWLRNLESNMTYHLQMICYSNVGAKFHSNLLRFDTGLKLSVDNFMLSSDMFNGNYEISRDRPILNEQEHSQTVQSSRVILGAVCGIVGFLIINVTVVMAVRKFSHRQMRWRRMLEIEERDYNDFPHLRVYE